MIHAATPIAYAGEIAQAARQHGVDPVLLAAVAAQETGGPGSDSGRNIVGDGGHGHGVFQIDDRWHAFARTDAAMQPGRNADYAAGMIADLLHRYGGDARKALSAYNAGNPNAIGTVTTWQDGARLGYADSVFRHYARLEGEDRFDLHASNEAQSRSAFASQSQTPAFDAAQGFMLGAPFASQQQPVSYRQLMPHGAANPASIIGVSDSDASNDEVNHEL